MNPTEHKSETPETDAVVKKSCDETGDEFLTEDLLLHARKLERERDQARRERDEARHKLSQFLLTKPEIIEEFLRHLAIRVDLLGTDMSDCDGYDDPIESVAQWIHSRHVGASQEIDQLRARVGELEKRNQEDLAKLEEAVRLGSEQARAIDELAHELTGNEGEDDPITVIRQRFAELEKDKERLDEALQRCLNVAYENPDDWRVQIGQAVDDAMKGQE